MTNVTYLHTCPICRLNLITSLVSFTHREFFQLVSHVISSPCVDVPIGVHPVGVISHSCKLIIKHKTFIIPMLEVHHSVALLLAQLTP
jgi:hypothetical protein